MSGQMTDGDWWATEKRFWLEGPDLYEALLDPECVMAFPGVGVVRASEILDSLTRALRWASVLMSNGALGRPGNTLVVLGYAAQAQREGALPYRCFCTSSYRLDAGTWKLVQHQQTIAD